jgi:vacuolar-type H+-ATPase subunit H
MNHHDNQPASPDPADEAMNQVLRAERDAERAVAVCEQEARLMLKAAQQKAQRIAARTNQRISMLQSSHGQKLNRTIKDIERSGRQAEQANAKAPFDEAMFNAVIDELAAELTTVEPITNADGHT